MRSHASGPLIPCAYAPHTQQKTETYATIWSAIRAQMGEESADTACLRTIDFEQAAINAAISAFPWMTFGRCYFHL